MKGLWIDARHESSRCARPALKPTSNSMLTSTFHSLAQEESNLRATSLESSGSLLFCSAPPEIDGDVNREGKTTGWSAVVHMYLCDGWEGEPAE